MKTLDNFSKRMLIFAFSISIILLSSSALVLSIQTATADPKQLDATIPSIAVDNTHVYFLIKNTSNGSSRIRKVKKDSVKNATQQEDITGQ